MCGIVGAVAQRNVEKILLEGLKRLEYRGYDSAGIAVIDDNGVIQRSRVKGKVSLLAQELEAQNFHGHSGIAHTRWATHGAPSEENAHPHISHDFVLVHNGIIENYEILRKKLLELGYVFESETDTEVIVHLVSHEFNQCRDMFQAVKKAIKQLKGAFALGILHRYEPHRLIAVRQGSPLVIGLGIDENFIASDQLALLPVTQRFIYLEEGDLADVYTDRVLIYNGRSSKPIIRPVHETDLKHEVAEKGPYRHFMLKEIFEQGRSVSNTLLNRLQGEQLAADIFSPAVYSLLAEVQQLQIVACGTSYHAAMVGSYWLEDFARMPCRVELASEFRYRHAVVTPNTLLLTLSQSGETADTLAALRHGKQQGYRGSLTICNVSESSLVRESAAALMTQAGPEIGVASTKAFTTQLTALLLLTVLLGQRLPNFPLAKMIAALRALPGAIEAVLHLDKAVEKLAEAFVNKDHALFLGRGSMYPIALEGALKLKEISYIHAEAYAAGELKHGPLALIDENMPVVVVAPNDQLLEKLKSNLQEVRARGGQLFVFADKANKLESSEGFHVISMPSVDPLIAPIIYNIPLQLLAYYVAVLKGTDVDQPRNLAKSVTVE